MHVLSTPIEYLKGVGPVRSELLKKELRIFTYEDLLFHFPFRYVDKSNIYKISEIIQAYIQRFQNGGSASTLGVGANTTTAETVTGSTARFDSSKTLKKLFENLS